MQRGNIIRHNRFHHVRMVDEIHLGNPVVQGVYLDDGMSGWRICESRSFNPLSRSFSLQSSPSFNPQAFFVSLQLFLLQFLF